MPSRNCLLSGSHSIVVGQVLVNEAILVTIEPADLPLNRASLIEAHLVSHRKICFFYFNKKSSPGALPMENLREELCTEEWEQIHQAVLL